MSYFNYFFQLNSFSDRISSSSPNLTNFNWIRDIQGVVVNNPSSQSFTMAPSTSITVFTAATKKFLYVETDKDLALTINGISGLVIKPVVVGSSVQPGTFLFNSTLTALIITNSSTTDTASVFVASAE